jgi:hypothetical protein
MNNCPRIIHKPKKEEIKAFPKYRNQVANLIFFLDLLLVSCDGIGVAGVVE